MFRIAALGDDSGNSSVGRSLTHRLTLCGLVLAAILAALTIAPSPSRAAEPVVTWGYLTMDDGTELRYTLTKPAEDGSWPTLFHYDGYTAGTDQPPFPQWKNSVDRYAHMSVQARGTGCSAGGYDFFSQKWSTDGKAIVDWIAEQNWSTGKVGMIGLSLPGITQLMVASQRPDALVAIAPGKADADLYRGIGRLGGMFNRNWVNLYEANLPGLWRDSAAAALVQGDPKCAENLASHPIDESNSMASAIIANPFLDDPFWKVNPLRTLKRIDIPMLATNGWQDDNVGGLGPFDFFRDLDRKNLWGVFSNGFHDPVGAVDGSWTDSRMPGSSDRWEPLYAKFFDHYLAGEDTGWEKTPRVTINQNVAPTGAAAWTDTYSTFPPASVRPVALYTRPGGGLAPRPSPKGTGTDSYRYPLESSAYGYAMTGKVGSWDAAKENGGALTYTSPVLEKDVSVAGPASVDLWLKSTASDTDLQVTVSEILPTSEERYIQRGWLRASNRKLATTNTTPIHPEHPFSRAAAADLPSGKPSLTRVGIVPFAHVFQTGTRIRFTIDAPTAPTSLDKLDYIETPSTNSVLSTAKHPSRIVLPVVPGKRAKAPIPGCDGVRAEPCRPGTGPLPGGKLDLSGAPVADPGVKTCRVKSKVDRGGRFKICLRTSTPVKLEITGSALKGKVRRGLAKAGAQKLTLRLKPAKRKIHKTKIRIRTTDSADNIAVRTLTVRPRR